MDYRKASHIYIEPNSLLNEDDLAQMFGKECRETIKRAIEAGELPPPVRIRGRNYWTGVYILNFINERLGQRYELMKKHLGK